ncbi:MAG: hypothetical protein LBK54_12435 [Propionibacteriaceae bacterium]|nr:hypothetical protein [Propionibacteriaceae bacterium]
MTAQLWQLEQPETDAWERPRLRVVEDRAVDRRRPPERSAAGPAGRLASVRLAPARSAGWELTRRGRALARGTMATLFGGAVFTIVWSFFQVSNAPLP